MPRAWLVRATLVGAALLARPGRAQPALAEPAGPGAAADGLPGLLRVGTPTAAAPGVTLAAALGYGFTGAVLGQDDTHHRGSATLAVGARATPWLGVGLRVDARHDTHSGAAGDDDGTILDWRLTARAGLPVAPRVRLGVDVAVWFPGHDALALAPEGVSLDLTGTLAARVSPRVLVAARAGFRLDRSAATAPSPAMLSDADRLALGLSRANAALMGAGLHVRAGRGAILAEWTWDVLFGEDAPAVLESPQRLGLAARWPLGEVTVQAGIELALSQRPAPSTELVPVEPRVSVLVAATYRFGAGSPGRADSGGGTGGGGTTLGATPPPGPTRRLRGRVIDAGGAPLAGAAVRVVTPSGAAGSAPASTTTGAGGDFELDVPRGEVQVTIEPPAPWAPYTTTLPAGEDATMLGDVPVARSTPPGQIRGVVRNLSGRALAASVRLEPGDLAAATAADGSFVVDVPPGEYDVDISAPGHRRQRRHVTVEQDGVTVLNVELRPGKDAP